jgi:hypothetical protein
MISPAGAGSEAKTRRRIMFGCLFLGLAGMFLVSRCSTGTTTAGITGAGRTWAGLARTRRWLSGPMVTAGVARDEDGAKGSEGPRWMSGRWGRGFIVRRLSARSTTPAQEKVIRAATDEFRRRRAAARASARGPTSRRRSQGQFDEVLLGELTRARPWAGGLCKAFRAWARASTTRSTTSASGSRRSSRRSGAGGAARSLREGLAQ